MFSRKKADEAEKSDVAVKKPSEVIKIHDNNIASVVVPEKPKKPIVPASHIAGDMVFDGNIVTEGSLNLDGRVEGNIRAHLLSVNIGACVQGAIIAYDLVVSGEVKGNIRALKVRLTSTAHVNADIIHKIIALETGGVFNGKVLRHEAALTCDLGETKPQSWWKRASN